MTKRIMMPTVTCDSPRCRHKGKHEHGPDCEAKLTTETGATVSVRCNYNQGCQCYDHIRSAIYDILACYETDRTGGNNAVMRLLAEEGIYGG
jgi:hypothetical protein